MEIDEETLAYDLTKFYDSLKLAWTRLASENKLSRGEIEVVHATYKAWANLMLKYDIQKDEGELRGSGAWEFDEVVLNHDPLFGPQK